MKKQLHKIAFASLCMLLTQASHCQNNQPTFPCYPQYEYDSDANMITEVQFNTISNSSSSLSGATATIEDFRHLSTTVQTGETYQISVKGPSSTFPSDVMVYVDYNQDGAFTEDEGIYLGMIQEANPYYAQTVTGNLTIPFNAIAGQTTLRIIKNTNTAAYDNPNAPNSITNSCDQNLRAGQVEEYSVVIEQTQETPAVSIHLDNELEDNVLLLNNREDYIQLQGHILPAAASQRITWRLISGFNFVNLNNSGLLNAVADGTAVIRGEVVSNPDIFLEITVKVILDEIVDPEGYCGAEAVTTSTVNPILSFQIEEFLNNSDHTEINGAIHVLNSNTIHQNFTSEVISLPKGSPLNVVVQGITADQDTHVVLYIDLNQNKNFDENEAFDLGFLSRAQDRTATNEIFGSATTQITLPETAFEGETRMRLVSAQHHPESFFGPLLNAPCPENWFIGQMEDYTINITAQTASVTAAKRNNSHAYPNPTKDLLNIHSTKEIININVYDMLGKHVMEQKNPTLNLSPVAKGIYQVLVKYEDQSTQVFKISKQ